MRSALTLQSLAASAGQFTRLERQQRDRDSSANMDIKSGGLLTINNDVVAGRAGYVDERGGDDEGFGEDRGGDTGNEHGRHDRGERG